MKTLTHPSETKNINSHEKSVAHHQSSNNQSSNHQAPNHKDSNSHAPADASSVDTQQLPTTEEISTLLYMIEEEKMARDVYDTLFEQTGIEVFDKISDSEQKHYDTLLKAAENLQIDTSTLETQAGVFSNDSIQSLYDTLLLQGSISNDDAIAVGIAIEQTDIADLQETMEVTDITLLGQVYTNLLEGSQHHLSAFEALA